MKHKIDAFFLAFLIAMLAPIEGAYGLQFSTSGGGGAGGSGSVSMNIRAGDSASVNSEVSINNAVIAPTTRLIGATSLFEETHSVKDSTGKSASVYVKVANAPSGLTYSSQVLPGEGSVAAQPSVSAEQWLTVPKADSIVTKAASSYSTLSSDAGLEETKGSSTGDYVTLNGYDGFASASASSVSANQIATSGTANSIKIYGDAKDSSGSYSINTPLTGISGGKATFNTLNAQSSAGTTTQVTQIGHVNGGFTSKLTAGTKTQTRTSNYGTDYDLNMMATKSASGPSVSGILGYYVSPTTSANKIQGAVNAAQSGDWINVLAGTYKENVVIGKSLTVNGAGAGKTIVDGHSSGTVFDLGLSNTPTAVNLFGMTIQGGNGKSVQVGPGQFATIGGGIQNYNCKLTVADSIISGNTATWSGGGIHNDIGSTLTLTGTTVTGNTATYLGGGIMNDHSNLIMNSGSSITNNIVNSNDFSGGGGVYTDSGTMVMNGGTISGNKALGGEVPFGGGVYIDGSTFTMNGGTISGNTAGFGAGGVYIDVGSIFNMNGGTISGNTAGVTGGGVYSEINDKVTMNGGTITGNTAGETAGGIYMDAGSIFTMNGGSITNNVATNGGGIYSSNAVTTLNSGSLIAGNTANNGGGIYNDIGSTLTLNGGTISGNIASVAGGGIYNDNSVVNLKSGTITSNIAKTTSGGGILNVGTITGNTGIVHSNTPNDIIYW